MWQFLKRFSNPAPSSDAFPTKYLLVYHGQSGPCRAGHLSYEDGVWSFEYDDEYKQNKDLTPIDGFDDIERTYRSAILFPFFTVRLPDPRRPDIAARIKEGGHQKADPLYMLAMFGQRSVASPAFELEAA